MKLSVIVDTRFSQSFQKLMKAPGIPVKTLFKLRVVAKAIKDAMADYDNLKNKLVEDFCEKDPEGKPISEKGSFRIPTDKIKDYLAAVQEMGAQEIEVSDVSISELGDKIELTPEDITFLEFITE